MNPCTCDHCGQVILDKQLAIVEDDSDYCSEGCAEKCIKTEKQLELGGWEE